MAFKNYDSSGNVLSRSITDLPVGTIVSTALSAAPSGWLICDGAAVSRTNYPELFGALGTGYGAGNGTTTFNVPNSDGQMIFAISTAQRIGVAMPPQFVTTLPASPIDGTEVYYQADSTNGVIWHLRYRAASASAYKWEYVGGSELTTTNTNYPNAQSPSTYTDIPSSATITVPLAGDYVITFAGKHDATTTSADNYCLVSAATSSIAASDDYSQLAGFGGLSYSTNNMRFGFSRTARMDGLAASAVVKLQLRAYNLSTRVHHTSMVVRPIRVSA